MVFRVTWLRMSYERKRKEKICFKNWMDRKIKLPTHVSRNMAILSHQCVFPA